MERKIDKKCGACLLQPPLRKTVHNPPIMPLSIYLRRKLYLSRKPLIGSSFHTFDRLVAGTSYQFGKFFNRDYNSLVQK